MTRLTGTPVLLLFAFISCGPQPPPQPLPAAGRLPEARAADTSGSSAIIHPQVFAHQIKLLEEFFERFNGIRSAGDGSSAYTAGRRQVFHLMAAEATRQKDSSTVVAFADSILWHKDHRQLRPALYDGDFFARVACTARYHADTIALELTLQYRLQADSSARWVLVGARSSLMEPTPEGSDGGPAGSIKPTAHELFFQQLPSVLTGAGQWLHNTDRDFFPDQLSMLIFLLQQGALQLGQVERVRFYFLQVPQWIFTVEYFNRATYNSGWLISDFFQASDGEKNRFLVQELGVVRRQYWLAGERPLREEVPPPGAIPAAAGTTAAGGSLRRVGPAFVLAANRFFQGEFEYLDTVLQHFADPYCLVPNAELQHQPPQMEIRDYLLLFSILQDSLPQASMRYELLDPEPEILKGKAERFAAARLTRHVSIPGRPPDRHAERLIIDRHTQQIISIQSINIQ